MGAKDLAEKNLLQYKDVFSDIVNVNLFGGRCYVSAEELSREPGELITKAVSDDKLRQLQMDVPMKCKKHNRSFFLCLENQSDKNNVMPVRDMGYQHAKYMEQIKEAKESNRKTGNYPTPMTKELNDSQKLSPVITLVLNYSQKEWKKPRCLNDMLEFPEDIGEELTKWIPEHPICIINLASQSETTIRQYQSDFKYIVRYLCCRNDRKKLDEYFQTTEFELDHPEAFLDWLSAVTNDRRYRKAKELIEETEGKGGKELEQKIENLTADVEATESDIKALNQEKADAEKARDQVRESKEQADKELKHMEKQRNQLRHHLPAVHDRYVLST